MMKEEIRITSPEDVRCRAAIVQQNDDDQTSTTTTCSLRIDFQSWPGKKIRASDLAALIINESHRLESLVLDGVRVIGDFDNVTEALSTCHHLKSFDVFSCHLSNEPLYSLGTTMAKLPSPLVHICLSFSSTQQTPPWSILLPVLQNQAISKLFLNGFEAPTTTIAEDNNHNNRNNKAENDQVEAFFAACAASQTLQQFTCLPFSNRSFTNGVVGAIEQLIRKTTSIKVLKLSLAQDTNLRGVAQALQQNQSIQELDIRGNRRPPSQAALDFFCDTLEHHNFTLKELQLKLLEKRNTIAAAETQMINCIEFHLTLNRMGRQQLLALPASAEDWIETLAELKDLSSIFYFLKELNSALFPTGDLP